MSLFKYVACARLNMLVAHILNMLLAHGHGRGTCLSTCLVCAVCVVGTVVYVINDGLFCPKSLPTKKQDVVVI